MDDRDSWLERRSSLCLENSFLRQIFYLHGRLCASHPFEVIVSTLTLAICLSMGGGTVSHKPSPSGDDNLAIMTVIRCMALFYIYHKFRSLWKLGSKYVLGIAGLFTVFSSFVFSSSVINLLHSDLSELNEALPFFLILIDLSKASILAQYALSSSSQKEVRENIARGMAVLGPTLTLDTVVETLVIGVGTLSGVRRLEAMCCFACMSVIVNYVVFMSFFPACLSLALELSRERAREGQEGHPVWQLTSIARVLQTEDQKTNPVLQRVKVIMSAGLVLVHAHSRWPILLDNSSNEDESSGFASFAWLEEVYNCTTSNLNKLPVLGLTLILTYKYMYLEGSDNVQMPSGANESEYPTGTVFESEATNSATVAVQTELFPSSQKSQSSPEVEVQQPNNHTLPESVQMLSSGRASQLSDLDIVTLVRNKLLPLYRLEWALRDPARGVAIRRRIVAELTNKGCLDDLPFLEYDYSNVMGSCCENVLGYTPIPTGLAGPLLMNGKMYYVPMATTEGCLVASTNRGCRAIELGGGVACEIVGDGMTRGPVVKFQSVQRAAYVMRWIEKRANFVKIKATFDSTSRFARLSNIHIAIAGRRLYIRFKAFTGDAMGMNMLSKGTEEALCYIKEQFPDMEVVSISGNFCSDKKPAALNWLEGRGKSVVCEARIPARVVTNVLKSSASAIVEVNTSKNLIGSAMAGVVGGFNSQSANIVTAIFIATGQDVAQNVTSSNCITIAELESDEGDLYITCTMPSIEVGTIGGGTVLPAQASCLGLLGCKGGNSEFPGANSAILAQVICGTVLAGELSLLAALAAGDLVKSHMTHNRSQPSTPKHVSSAPSPSLPFNNSTSSASGVNS